MEKAVTVPKPCSACKGNGRTIVLAWGIDEMRLMEKVTCNIGFFRKFCRACNGTGAGEPLEPLGEYPPPPKDDCVPPIEKTG